MATASDRRVESLMIGAAGVMPAHIVNHTPISVDERAVDRIIAHHQPIDPGIDIVLRHPQPVTAKTADRLELSPPRQAFMSGSVAREKCGRRRCKVVGGLHIKRYDGAIQLPGNRSAED